jgi:hypothetical protein
MKFSSHIVLFIAICFFSLLYSQNLNSINPSVLKNIDPSIVKKHSYSSGEMNLKNDAQISRLLKDINERNENILDYQNADFKDEQDTNTTIDSTLELQG